MRNAAYFEKILGSGSKSQPQGECLSQVIEIEKDAKKLAKKLDKGKIGRKKFKKRLRKLERKLDSITVAMMCQQKVSPQYSWWQQTLMDSTPKALELAMLTLMQKDGQRRKQTCVDD